MNEELPVFWHAGHYAGDQQVQSHQHAGAEIIYISRGFCSSNTSESHLDVRSGQLVVIAPGTPHTQKNHEYTETLFAVFSVKQGMFDCCTRLIDIGSDELIVTWLRQLVKLNDAMLMSQCRGLMYSIICRLSMLESKLNNASDIMPQLNYAVNYIEENLTKPDLCQENIAKNAGISVSYLKKLFRREFDISPMKYVQKERMLIARQMLRNQYLFISEVGERCGYHDSNYFSRIFKQIHNVTPAEFRRSINTNHRDIKWNGP